MTISDVRCLYGVLSTMFDVVVFFDRMNNIEGGGRYGNGAYETFFGPIDKLHGLLNHPNIEVSGAAEKLDEIIEKLQQRNVSL
jgi:hypothetical protein